MTDLTAHIQGIRVCDTHEHLGKEHDWVEKGPSDVVIDLFSTSVAAGLTVGLIRTIFFRSVCRISWSFS